MTAVAHPPAPGVPGGLVDPGPGVGGDLVAAWRDLAARARHVNPFQGPDLLLPALRHLTSTGEDVRLWTLPGATPASLGLLLPVSTGRRHRRLPWRATVGWQHTHHFLGTPLVAPDLGPDGWRTALGQLAEQTPDSWLVLPSIDADVAADVEAAAARDHRGVRRLAEDARPATFRHAQDDYLEQQLPGSRRKELRRRFRRLSESVGGDLALVELVSAGRAEEGVEMFLRLEAAGWKGADGGAMAADPAQRVWFVEAARAAASRGGLEVLALVGADGDSVAMAVDLTTDDVRFTFKIAYDEQHAAWSPGLLLVMEQLHHFHASGAAMLDTCAEPGHAMASRFHPDHRTLVTLAVGLRGRRGALAAVTAPRLLRAGDAGRARLHDVRRRLHSASTDTTRTDTTTTPTPGGNPS